MEASHQLRKLQHDLTGMSSVLNARTLPNGIPIGLESWLSPPLLVSSLPGFLAHPQAGYPSYIASGPSLGLPQGFNGLSSLMGSSFGQFGHNIGNPGSLPSTSIAEVKEAVFNEEIQNSSLNALRLRAKEHMDTIAKELKTT